MLIIFNMLHVRTLGKWLKTCQTAATRGRYNTPSPPFSPPPSPIADVTSGLEAQQKYSTGYIRCVHEVHNTLLTCEWMDRSLGSRLLHHLLKSLPRPADRCPPRGGSAAPSGGSGTARKRPADQGESPPPQGPQLEMWRPW